MNNKDLLLEDLYEFHLELSRNSHMRIFNYQEHRKSRDILSIAFGVFRLEKEMKKRNVNKFSVERFVKNDKNRLKKALSELISYVLLKHVDIKFYYSRKNLSKKGYIYDKPIKCKASVLFSGGVDSYSGIFWAKKYFNNDCTGVFCAHSDQPWNIHIVNSLFKRFLSPSKIKLETIYVPPITKGGYSQLRGFLYLVSAGALMELLGSDTLIISECGATMYQPRFGPYDMVTMTTHPVVVEIASSVLELLLEKKIKIFIPFENMTKAEVIAFSPKKKGFKETHSCVSLRFGRHDGTCYGCCIRRLGAITAGVEDVKYDNNPIIEEKANKENLLSLLKFSLDILINYKDMPLYSIENIESYNKLDLFKRFALDNFSAIHLLKKNGLSLNKEVEYIYEECLDKVGTEELNERIENIRNKKFQINTEPIYKF